MTETWKPVPGWVHYEVSDWGRVRSLDRMIMSKRSRSGYKFCRGRVLKFGQCRQYQNVTLQDKTNGLENKTVTVHTLVLTTFVGPRPDGMEVRHLDGNPHNNKLSNLTWGTKSENMSDKLVHKTNPMANKTHCVNGHEFTKENTRVRSTGWRDCRTCEKIRYHKKRAQQ